ncbi:MAG: hypothetical protein DRO73_02275 [Candidatus Thorarchaeota archaeon]|nr:MAG: hypothetical protein DRO73_02275 [Candidatus Thorarchaeota archaeon]RLI53829.1 MAG: hypothetical protein DRO87_11055 [Candidatus Thorarchaeota archaeon]
MARTKKVGSTGRFGPRYGAKLRRRVLDIEKRRAEPHRCPSCATKGSLHRKAAGLWVCRKCGLVFAGGAYVPYTDAGKAARRAIAQRVSDSLLSLREETEEEVVSPAVETPIPVLEAEDDTSAGEEGPAAE